MKTFLLFALFVANAFAQDISGAPIIVSITSRDPWDRLNPKAFIINDSIEDKSEMTTFLRKKPELALKLNDVISELKSERIAKLVSTIGARLKDSAYISINLDLTDLTSTVTVKRNKSVRRICEIDTADGKTAEDALKNLKMVKEDIVHQTLIYCLEEVERRHPPKLEDTIEEIINDKNCA